MPDTVYDAGPQGLNRYSYALNNPLRYLDPTGRLAYAAQYALATPYDMLPYIDQVDTGNNLADQALAVGAGVYNLGAMLVNALPNAYGVTEEAYNAGTEAVIGQKGLSGQGLTEDLLVLEASGMPLGTIIEQAKQSGAYLKTYIQANAARLQQWGKAALASETGSVYLGGETPKNIDDLVTVRHHTDPASLKRIKSDNAIKAGRPAGWDDTIGVHVEVEPFGPAKSAARQVGATNKGAFVEFQIPETSLKPTYVGPRKTAVIPTNNALSLEGKAATFHQTWWRFWE